MPRRLALLLRVLASTGGKAAAQRALPLYLGIGLLATVIFEGNGLQPSRLTALAGESRLFRCGMWAAWLLLGMPASRALLCAPGALFLRALPIPRWQHLTAHGLFMTAAEIPWLLLWTRGAGALAGGAACLAAMALHGLLVARPRRAEEIAAALGLTAAIVLGARAPLLFSIATPALFVGLRAAWLRAPEGAANHALSFVRGPAPVALALSHGMSLVRGHQAVLLRGLLLTAFGALSATAWARTTGPLDPEPLARLSLAVFAPIALLTGAGVAGPVLHHERRIRWLLDTCGTPTLIRRVATAGAVAAPVIAGGVAHGAALGTLAGSAPAILLRLSAGAALTGLLLSAIALDCVRWAERLDGRDSGRVLVALLAALPLAIALAWSLGELSWLVWAGSAALLSTATARGLQARPGPGAMRHGGAP